MRHRPTILYPVYKFYYYHEGHEEHEGVRVPDVAWGSKEYVQKHIKDIYALSAPELCAEIISSSNTREEMEGKVELFLEAGAKEVWLITEDGQVTYYNNQGQQVRSMFDIDLKGLA